MMRGGPEEQFDESFESPDMDEYLSDVTVRICPNCGKAIIPNRRGRPRVFCSMKCYRKFWNTHPRPDSWNFYVEKICPVCGKSFLAKKDGKHTKTYCSRACANRARSRKFRKSGNVIPDPGIQDAVIGSTGSNLEDKAD